MGSFSMEFISVPYVLARPQIPDADALPVEGAAPSRDPAGAPDSQDGAPTVAGATVGTDSGRWKSDRDKAGGIRYWPRRHERLKIRHQRMSNRAIVCPD